MIGHSMGGDIVMYFAKEYPDEVKWVVTLDNLRVRRCLATHASIGTSTMCRRFAINSASYAGTSRGSWLSETVRLVTRYFTRPVSAGSPRFMNAACNPGELQLRVATLTGICHEVQLQSARASCPTLCSVCFAHFCELVSSELSSALSLVIGLSGEHRSSEHR